MGTLWAQETAERKGTWAILSSSFSYKQFLLMERGGGVGSDLAEFPFSLWSLASHYI